MTEVVAAGRGRKIIKGVGVVLVFLLIVLSVVSFLLSNQSGSRWLVGKGLEFINDGGVLSLSVSNLEGSLFRGLSIEGLEVSSGEDRYSVRRLVMQWEPWTLLSGSFYLTRLEAEGVRATLATPADDSAATEIAWPQQALSPIALNFAEVEITDIEITRAGEVYPIDYVALSASLRGIELELDDLTLRGVQGSVGGDLQVDLVEFLPLRVALNWSYQGAPIGPYEELQGELDLDGDLRSLSVDSRLILPMEIRSTGTLRPGIVDDALELSFSHTAASLVFPDDPSLLENVTLSTIGDLAEVEISLEAELVNPALPLIRLSGTARYLESRLLLESYRLATATGSLSGSAEINFDDQLTASGEYAILDSTPLAYYPAELPLELSELSVAGSFDVALEETGPVGELHIQSLTGQTGIYPLQGSGSIYIEESRLRFSELQLATQSNSIHLDGTIAGDVDVNWVINAPALAELVPEISGDISGAGSAQGEITALDVQGQLESSLLQFGAVSVESAVILLDRTATQLNADLQVATLTYAEGSVKETISDLAFTLIGTEAEHALRLSANSNYGGLALDFRGGVADLQNPQWLGQLMNGSVTTPVGPWSTLAPADVALSAETVALENSCWGQQEASVCILLQADAEAGVEASMVLEDYLLSSFNVTSETSVSANSQAFVFPQLPNYTSATGFVNGEMHLTVAQGQQPTVDVTLTSSNAGLAITQVIEGGGITEFDYQDYASQVYLLDHFDLQGEYELGAWNATFDSSFSSRDIEDSEESLQGDVMATLGLSAEQILTGQISLHMDDLAWIEALIPELTLVEGELEVEVDIGGSIELPEFTGSVLLADAALSIEPLGISVTELQSSILSQRHGTADFSLSTHSGDGQIELTGSITNPLRPDRSISGSLRGEQFQFVNLEDMQLAISPDLSLLANSERIDIQGSLHIPSFMLTTQELPDSAIDISRDVVIVNYPADRPDLARADESAGSTLFDVPVSGAVRISLGDEVGFSGFGLTTQLAGSLDIEQSIDGSNLTFGELSIREGSYRMYGQTLEIRQGKLLFFGAYDNPAIDIRAIREVENQTVGVLMNGTLKNMSSQLFSTPALPESDIIAVLVTGRPYSQIGSQDSDALLGAVARLGLDQSEGLTNQIRDTFGLDTLTIEDTEDISNSVLMVGKYLTPSIFVRYGIGLFDSQPKIAVDYTLSERIKLQAESGEFQSVDITYTVER